MKKLITSYINLVFEVQNAFMTRHNIEKLALKNNQAGPKNVHFSNFILFTHLYVIGMEYCTCVWLNYLGSVARYGAMSPNFALVYLQRVQSF